MVFSYLNGSVSHLVRLVYLRRELALLSCFALKDVSNRLFSLTEWETDPVFLANTILYLSFFVIGDGIMDMMLKPALQTYESKDAPKDVEEGDDDDWIQKKYS